MHLQGGWFPVLAVVVITTYVLRFAGKLQSFLKSDRLQAYATNQKANAVEAPLGFTIDGVEKRRKGHLQFFSIDDQVMGGSSQSELTFVKENGHKEFVFKGEIVTKGGGFAGCRTLGDEETLGLRANATAFKVRGVGDGRQYRLTVHTADSWNMSVPSWSHDFLTEPAGKEQTWTMPLPGFVPTIQGKRVEGYNLHPPSVTGLGFVLSMYTSGGSTKPNEYFGAGPFELRVKRIAVV